MELDSDMAQVVWLSENSIPVTKENAELIPYIMVAPDYVDFFKNLSNGYVVVVERRNIKTAPMIWKP